MLHHITTATEIIRTISTIPGGDEIIGDIACGAIDVAGDIACGALDLAGDALDGIFSLFD